MLSLTRTRLPRFTKCFPQSRPGPSSTDWRSTPRPNTRAFLNIAEIELSVLARQGLAHNIATLEELCRQVEAWQEHRNQRLGTVNWQFRTADARIKLQRLYPMQQPDAQLPGSVV